MFSFKAARKVHLINGSVMVAVLNQIWVCAKW